MMTCSTSHKLGELLRPFVNDVEESSATVRFGHITIPPFRSGDESLMESMRQLCKASGSKKVPFFVVPDIEHTIGTGLREGGNVRHVTLTFSTLLETIRANKLDGEGGTKWRSGNISTPLENWENDQILPVSIIMFLWLDPKVSADCALALTGTVKWAIEEAGSLTDIVILTMSHLKDCEILPRLVSSMDSTAKVEHLDLTLPDKDPVADCVMHDGQDVVHVAERIVSSWRKSPERKRIIVSFNSNLWNELQQCLSQGEHKDFRLVLITGDDTRALRALHQIAQGLPSADTLVLMVSSLSPVLPPRLEGFDELHVLLESEVQSDQVWDRNCAQVTTQHRLASQEERRLQKWWCYQPSIASRLVHNPAPSIHEFSQGGHCPRLVENAQLGGFIVAAVDLVPWGIDPDAMVACFVRYSLRVQEMMYHLTFQRIIDDGALVLSKQETITFRAVLPHLSYDHRLALLVAIDANPLVRFLKVLVAVILKVGVSGFIEVQNQGPIAQLCDRILQQYKGLGEYLPREGVLWLLLGHLGPRFTAPDGAKRATPKNRLILNPRKLSLFIATASDIMQLLSKRGVDIAKPVFWGADLLSLVFEKELVAHYIRAYTFQLTILYKNINGSAVSGSDISTKLIAPFSDCKLKTKSTIVSNLFNAEKLVDNGDSAFVYVTSHDLMRSRDGILSCGIWTVVPADLIREWLEGWDSSAELCEVLSSGIAHT